MPGLLSSESKLVARLVAYTIRRRPSVIPFTLVGIASSIIELAALLSIIPLSTLAGGNVIPPHSIWSRFAHLLGNAADAKFFTALFLSLLLLRTVTSGLSQLLSQLTVRRLIAHFSSRAFESFIRHLSFRDVQKQQIGHFLTLAGDEANRAAQIIGALMKLVPFIVLFLLYIGGLFYQSWQVGLGIFAFLGASIFLLRGGFRKLHRLGDRQQTESRQLNTHFIDALSGLRTVRSFNAENYVGSRYEKMINDYARTCFSIDALNAVFTNAPVILLLGILLIGAISLVGAGWLAGNMPVLLAGAVMFMRLLPLGNQALDVALRLTADLRAARNVSEMLEAIERNEKRDRAELVEFKGPLKRIDFENVSFRYSADAPKVLDSFSVSLEAGKSYALTGPSGAGKSSLIDLLLKFFYPDSGKISVNGHDIAAIPEASLRRHIILSEQAIRLFYDSVRKNVVFGQAAENQQVEEALDVVGLHEFLQTLPDGVETLLDYQGSNFSGGQRQRIGLARAILRSADVLIMDESTNALDFETRKRIMDRLLSSYRDRILIFVTHDAYITERVDEVIRLTPAQRDPPLEVAAAK